MQSWAWKGRVLFWENCCMAMVSPLLGKAVDPRVVLAPTAAGWPGVQEDRKGRHARASHWG